MTKILVIEDAEALRKDIIEMLSFEGFEVFGAGNGKQGLQVARESQPDLIICDIMMPELDGYGVLEGLQKDGDGLTVPFIFLTAKADKGDMRLGMQSGADDYLPKPFTATELISSVRKQLEKRSKFEKISSQKLEELRENIILALPHELRTPLTGILGFSDILVTDCHMMEADKVAEMAQYIYNAAQRLYHLTENYLVYAQLETMMTDAERREAMRHFRTPRPQALIEDTAIQKAQLYSREADLEMNVSDEATISALEDNLKKITQEVIDNAFKFSLPGTKVKIEGKMENNRYHLIVTDHGRGMTRQQISRVGVFMQFGRKWYEQQGSGFGLAIVKRSVELHGGSLLIDSEVDQYTRVTVQLPAVQTMEYAPSRVL